MGKYLLTMETSPKKISKGLPSETKLPISHEYLYIFTAGCKLQVLLSQKSPNPLNKDFSVDLTAPQKTRRSENPPHQSM